MAPDGDDGAGKWSSAFATASASGMQAYEDALVGPVFLPSLKQKGLFQGEPKSNTVAVQQCLSTRRWTLSTWCVVSTVSSSFLTVVAR
jgi:hypothetical protein